MDTMASLPETTALLAVADSHEDVSDKPSSPKRRRLGPSPSSADLTLNPNAAQSSRPESKTVPVSDHALESTESLAAGANDPPSLTSQPLRVLEFYSGIGGMHYALKAAGVEAQVLAAFEVFDAANSVYKHNFGKGFVKQGLLEAHKLSDFAKLDADIWTMSPPCQPYTRQFSAKQAGADDPRSKSFLYLLDVLRTLPLDARPRYLLVENVKGFDESVARDALVRTLVDLGYATAEFLLNPLQFGVPNSRLRYYLVARRDGTFKSVEVRPPDFPEAKSAKVQEERTSVEAGSDKPKPKKIDTGSVRTDATPSNILDTIPGEPVVPLDQVHPLCEYLEPMKEEPQAWKDAVVWKRTPLFDIVTPSSRRSCCFTKNYVTYFEGTGSVLQENDELDIKDIWPEFLSRQPAALAQLDRKEPVTDVENPLLPLRLRFFSPREVANLMCFPPDFEFPKGISEKQKYRLLGNSINVLVVAKVMQFMLDTDR